MNAPDQQSTALTVVQSASLALGAAEHEKALIELAQSSTAIVTIKDAVSYRECHGARMGLKNKRILIEGIAEDARKDAREFAKAVIAEEKRLIAIIAPEEQRLQTLQDAHDAKVEAEKQAKIEAERNRVATIQAEIDEIKQLAIGTIGKDSAWIAACMEQLERDPIDERFAEYKEAAEAAKVQTMNRLNVMHGLVIDAETEAKRIAEERAELERQKAAQAERERLAEQERQALAREEKRLMEEGIARRMEEERLVRERNEAAERESRARIEAQEREARQAREAADVKAKAELEAQEARLRAERERLEKERLAKEVREKAKREAAQGKSRAKREKEEAAEREKRRKEAEVMDANHMLVTFRERFGHLKEFARVIEAINTLPNPAFQTEEIK